MANSSGINTCISAANADTANTATYEAVRGALLGSRFRSFDELKSVIQIEYENGTPPPNDTTHDNRWVRVRHCSDGRVVINVLEKGTSEGDFLKALKRSAVWYRLLLLFRCPYAVIHRADLEKTITLSRWKPDWFGEGDLAFFDMAKASVTHINTPELAFRNPQDSTEKGYLNTFNHITAQAFLTSCFSEELADFIGDTHERYRHPELITGRFSQEKIMDLAEGPVDNYVDLINNEWGQELGKRLKAKYNINSETNWTPELLANYLNDLLGYFSWAFQIGFDPFRPEDEEVRRFSKKLEIVLKGNSPHF